MFDDRDSMRNKDQMIHCREECAPVLSQEMYVSHGCQQVWICSLRGGGGGGREGACVGKGGGERKEVREGRE